MRSWAGTQQASQLQEPISKTTDKLKKNADAPECEIVENPYSERKIASSNEMKRKTTTFSNDMMRNSNEFVVGNNRNIPVQTQTKINTPGLNMKSIMKNKSRVADNMKTYE